MNTKQFEGHTPGPWIDRGGDLYGSDGDRVAFSSSLIALASINSFPKAKLNAALALAAPELLAEIERLRTALDAIELSNWQPCLPQQLQGDDG